MGLSSPEAHPDDVAMMRRALAEAERCLAHGDVPIGAVVSRGEEVLAAAGTSASSPGTRPPAEILALRAAGDRFVAPRRLHAHRHVEPCACAGAASSPADWGVCSARPIEGRLRGLAG